MLGVNHKVLLQLATICCLQLKNLWRFIIHKMYLSIKQEKMTLLNWAEKELINICSKQLKEQMGRLENKA